MVPNLLSTILALCLVCSAVLDGAAFEAHPWLPALAGAALIALGFWAHRIDHLKWAGIVVVVAGAANLLLALSGIAVRSSETAFWVIFWSANVAGVVSLWSALYRGEATGLST
ncbi:MAG TPA: hypothetical protein VKT27_15760 [Candidatus Binataceae bacterium]|nr:hypothetical protein [Candidatus Binataceae bacterium]